MHLAKYDFSRHTLFPYLQFWHHSVLRPTTHLNLNVIRIIKSAQTHGCSFIGGQYAMQSNCTLRSKKRPRFIFQIFFSLFGPGLFYTLRVPAKVKIFLGSFFTDPFAPKNGMRLKNCSDHGRAITLPWIELEWNQGLQCTVFPASQPKSF